MDETVEVATNLAVVRERVALAAHRAGRRPEEITLVAVSKTKPLALIRQAMAAGQVDFGENLVEEAWAKFGAPESLEALRHPGLGAGLRLHLIGPIQSRKAAMAVACRPCLIHSIDRLKIAGRLDRFAGEAGVILDVLLEVNVSGEASKFGFTCESVRQEAEAILALPNLRVRGLMTIPPYELEPEAARPHFAALRYLRDELARRYPQADWLHLSMGMSHDFEVAIEEGATIVRVGAAIFGARPVISSQ